MSPRPSRAGTEARSLTIRATESERAAWSAAASASGLNLAEWIRRAADLELARDRGALDLAGATRSLREATGLIEGALASLGVRS